MHRSFVVILICLAFSTLVHAGDNLDNYPDLFCDPGKTAGNNPAFGGKPVSLFSGMETFAPNVDLTLGSFFPVRITRSYNSRTSYDAPLGYGWAINYDKRLYTYADNSVTVRRDCGGKRRFTWTSPAGYIGQTGDTGALVQNPDGSYTYTDKYGETEKYDAQGRLSSMADAKGNSLAFTYTSATREFLYGLLPFNIDQNNPVIVAYDYHLSKIEEKDATSALTGKYVDLHYDSTTGRLIDIIDSTGRTVSYGHDTIGNLTTAIGPSTNATYAYTDPNNKHVLTSINEGAGEIINTYDTTGRVTKQTRGAGEISFVYTIPYQKTTMTTLVKDSNNNLLNTQTRTVEFDTNGMVKKVTDTNGNITTYIRDNTTTWLLYEIKTDITTSQTTTTAYTYDAKGSTLTRTEAMGTAIEKTTDYTYDPIFNRAQTITVQSVVNPALYSTTTNSYDPSGNLSTTTETGLLGDGTTYSYTTTYTYDANGRIATIDGPRIDVNDITTYTYDPATGNLISTIQPLIGSTIYSNHDQLGNPQTVTDPNGNATTYTYDANGRVLTVKAAGDTNATQYFYVGGGCGSGCSGANKIDHITLPEGNTISYTYDTMGNLARITDNAGNSINYTYDSEGNKLTEDIRDASNALQKTLSYTYDALNRLKRITNPDSNYAEYTYDYRGNRAAGRNPNATITSYTYDALNRLTSTRQPLNASTSYAYDTNNNLTSVKDTNNNTTSYRYDDRSRVFQVISPDTGTTTYSYDPAGNMISKTDAKGVTISYVYDALNRLTKIDFPTDTDIVYVYDNCVNGKGRLCSMTDASGMTVYEYTAKAQVKKETKTIDSIQYVTQYSYDQNGNLKTMTYPSGRVITYNYSNDKAVSILNNAANLATNINYKPFGGMSSITYGNGITGSINYDNQYRITAITAGTVMNLSYPTYDANGNITAINNVLDATKNKSFGYDALDRLSTATASGIWGSLAWTYDGVGNRQTEGSTVYSYAPGTNKLTGAGGTSFSYDNNGNTTSHAARSYTYNGNGQRVKKTVNGVATVFHYDQRGQLVAESDGTGATTTEYVYLNGQPLSKIEGATVYYYHNDHLATPQKMTDSTGTVVWSADYKPFGEATITISTITNNLRFPGQYYDAETGLHQNNYRDYNNSIGRYIETDPFLLPFIYKGESYFVIPYYAATPSNIHDYLYAANNPLQFSDFLGLHHIYPPPLPPNIRNLPPCDQYNALVAQLTARIATLEHDLSDMRSGRYDWDTSQTHARQRQDIEVRLNVLRADLNALRARRNEMCRCPN